MTQTFNVIVTGECLPGVTREQMEAAFAKLFKLDPAQAAATLARAPLLIKRGVDAASAQTYANALNQAGIAHRLEDANPAAAPDLAKPAAAPAPATPPAPSLEKTAPPPAAAATPEAGLPVKQPAHQRGDESIFEPAAPKGYRFRIEGKPDYGFVTVHLNQGDMIKVEASAMATMDTHVQMKTKMKGGLSRLLSGENLFINEFTAQGAPGEIGIAPAAPGDLLHRYLDNEIIYLQNSCFVACSPQVNVEAKWQGLVKGFFGGQGLFLVRAIGTGDLWFNTYGAAIEIEVTDEYVVDTGNVVAFTEGLEYKVTKVGGYKSLFLSGEGFVCRFTGKGKIWLQTRTPASFVNWASAFRPSKKG
ncbi:TIGR00266 family protein [Massilia sp. W12]|uniref:TIGR00266 family protein n=1 Tax=Massilia sp. W12 TaxID=3126507 RepID=UPI0030CC08FB